MIQMVFSNTTHMNKSYHLPAQVFILQCVEIRWVQGIETL
jgi:hypothetical protein